MGKPARKRLRMDKNQSREPVAEPIKNPAAVALGSLGGKKGSRESKQLAQKMSVIARRRNKRLKQKSVASG